MMRQYLVASTFACAFSVPSPFGSMGCNEGVDFWPDAIWEPQYIQHPSCGGTTRPDGFYSCAGDSTSVFMSMPDVGNKIGCFLMQSPCRFNMHDVQEITFDVDLTHCGSAWAAPFWMTPDPWVPPAPVSGEVDMVELCPVGSVMTNFASGGSPGYWADAEAGLNGPKHVRVWFDNGALAVDACELGTDICTRRGTYDNYFNTVHDVSSMILMTDIWNNGGGDAGACIQGGDPNTQCQFAVKNIRVRGPYFTGKCAALSGASPSPTPSPAPTPSPSPSPIPPGGCCSWATPDQIQVCGDTTDYCKANPDNCVVCSGHWIWPGSSKQSSNSSYVV